MVKSVNISGRLVGPGHPCLIIAEAGVNHNGDPEIARRLVNAAAEAGADAVKFQTFKADKLASEGAPKADYQRRTTSASESQTTMLRRLELSEEAHRDLMAHCVRRKILFLSSAFEEDSADLLDRFGLPAFKVPSGEITNLSFVEHVARFGKPLIVSTGMATEGEVAQAVDVIRKTGNEQIILLQCTSAYPADPADVNLRAMQTMADEFGVPVGYSDHTRGIEVMLAAVALGACVVEKHFTLDRSMPGPDHQASVDSAELSALVRGIRNVEKALGDGRKVPAASEADTAAVARKSLVAIKDVPKGAIITAAMIGAKRPGIGLAPAFRGEVLGKHAATLIRAGTLISWDMLK